MKLFIVILRFIFNIFILTLLVSCHDIVPEPRNKQELIDYVNDDSNGLSRKAQIDDFVLRAIYQPKGLAPKCMVCDEYAYFIVQMNFLGESGNKKFLDSHAFPESIETFAFRMGDYVKLIAGHDTISPADYSFQRTFGLDHRGNFLFVFPKKPIEGTEDFLLLVKSNGLVSSDLSLPFHTEDLLKTQRFNLQ